MVRRGSFGRLPPAATSLTSTIVAIAREVENQRAANIMDAWKQGGSFEGGPVTDERVMAFWRDRLKSLDRADPLYDTYSEAVSQLEYSIAESKMTASYAKGNKTDTEMAQFYLGWAKKVPRDSEFWRVLQRDAGQHLRQAKAEAAAVAKKKLEEDYQSDQQNTFDSQEKVGNYLTTILTAAMQQGLLPYATDMTDPQAVMAIFKQVESDAKGGGSTSGRYSFNLNVTPGIAAQLQVLGINVKTGVINGKDVMDQLAKLDPNTSGAPGSGYVVPLTYTYYSNALDSQLSGQTARLERARTTGHTTDMNSIASDIDRTQSWASAVGRWPVERAYAQRRATFEEDWADPSKTPTERLAAFDSWSKWLTSKAMDTALDPETRAMFQAEATGDATKPSMYEFITGGGVFGAENGGKVGDIGETMAYVNQFRAETDAVAQAGAAVAGTPGATPYVMWTMGKRDPQTGAFTPQAGGTDIGAATAYDISQAAGAAPVQLATLPGIGQVALVGTPINVVMRDANGKEITTAASTSGASANTKQVGFAFSATINGRRTTVYRFTSGGRTYFTQDPPWSPSATVFNDGKAITVDLTTAFAPITQTKFGVNDTAPDKLPVGVTLVTDPSSNVSTLVYNPADLLYNSDPVRQAVGGADPSTDFLSLSLAIVSGSTTLMEQTKDDSGFQRAIQFETMTAASNPDGTVDPAIQNKGNAQQLLAYNAPQVRDTVQKLFNRDNTKPTVETGVGGGGGNWATPGVAVPGASTLPAERLRGAATQFSAIASAFEPHTTKFAPTIASKTGMQITTPESIKVPSVDLSSLPGAQGIAAAASTAVDMLTRKAQTTTVQPMVSSPSTPGTGGSGSFLRR